MKKKLLSYVLASAMVLSLAGCGGSGSGTGTGSSGSSGSTVSTAPVTESGTLSYTTLNLDEYSDFTASIKFVHHKTDREEDGTMASMIAEFNKEFPNITVTTEAVTDYAEDSLLRLNTGDWGDIMFIPAVDKSDLATYFMPLDSLDNLSKELNFVSSWSYDGQCYGIPYMANAQGVLYNKKVFADAGITQLPRTASEFIAALKLISEKTDAIPLYTNYAAGWTMGAWDAYVGVVSNGDDAYMNQKLVHTAEPFSDPGDGSGAYNVYKILYDATAQKLIEDDYTTTDWEGSKTKLNNGEIGCMALGSWAYPQMEAAGKNSDDIGYMPFPITVDGKQYALCGADYSFGINVNASDDEKAAAMVFVKWMTEKSGFSYNEDGLPIDASTTDTKLDFSGVELLQDDPAVEGEEDLLNNLNSDSELNINAGGNDKIQAIIEHAANGDKSFDDIMKEWNEAWSSAQETEGVEVK